MQIPQKKTLIKGTKHHRNAKSYGILPEANPAKWQGVAAPINSLGQSLIEIDSADSEFEKAETQFTLNLNTLDKNSD